MKNKLEILKKEQFRYKLELSSLMYDYKEFQKFFIGVKSIQEAEDFFYITKFMESGYDSEGKFSLLYNHSLMSKIKENKEERNKISRCLKETKYKIRNINK